MRTLHVPLENREFKRLEAWRNRVEKVNGVEYPSWSEFLLSQAEET